MTLPLDICHSALTILDAHQAQDIEQLDVRSLTDITEYLIVCSATSTRHAAALRDKVVVEMKRQDHPPLCVDGQADSGWILIDLVDVIIHIMTPETRAHYALEKLWSTTPTARQSESS